MFLIRGLGWNSTTTIFVAIRSQDAFVAFVADLETCQVFRQHKEIGWCNLRWFLSYSVVNGLVRNIRLYVLCIFMWCNGQCSKLQVSTMCIVKRRSLIFGFVQCSHWVVVGAVACMDIMDLWSLTPSLSQTLQRKVVRKCSRDCILYYCTSLF